MIEWQYLFAASLYAIVPVVILFVGIEKNLVGGLTSGGVKGWFLFFSKYNRGRCGREKGLPRAALCSCPITIQKAVFRQVFLWTLFTAAARNHTKHVTGHPVTVLLCTVKFHIRNNPDDSAHFRNSIQEITEWFFCPADENSAHFTDF